MSTPFELTRDGFDRQWQVNYLAPHTLTSLLTPLLLSTAAGCGSKDRVRVVNVSSDMAWDGPSTINMEDVSLTKEKGSMAGLFVSLRFVLDRGPEDRSAN